MAKQTQEMLAVLKSVGRFWWLILGVILEAEAIGHVIGKWPPGVFHLAAYFVLVVGFLLRDNTRQAGVRLLRKETRLLRGEHADLGWLGRAHKEGLEFLIEDVDSGCLQDWLDRVATWYFGVEKWLEDNLSGAEAARFRHRAGLKRKSWGLERGGQQHSDEKSLIERLLSNLIEIMNRREGVKGD